MMKTSNIFYTCLWAVVTFITLTTSASSASSSLIANNQISLRQAVGNDDFEDFNNLFQSAVLKLPDTIVTDRVLGTTLTLKFRNMRCTNINVDDILLNHSIEDNNKEVSVKLDATGIQLDCFIDYRYEYGLLRGSGSADAYTVDNSFSTELSFTSLDFNEHPPNSITTKSCSTTINVSDLDIRGTLLSKIADTYERQLRGTVEDEVEKVACKELEGLATDVIADFLSFADNILEEYLSGQHNDDESISDALYVENNLDVPANVQLLNLKDSENIIGDWFQQALNEADLLLGSMIDNGNGGTDLGVNVYLRDYLLDNDHALTVQIPDGFSTLYDNHDVLTKTLINLDQVKLFGLDTFTKFEPLTGIGKYTLQNELSWEYLNLELDLTVTIEPSTLPDSLLENPGNVKIQEQIKVKFGIDQLEAVVSFLLAIDQNKLGEIELGSVLFTDNILPCLLSAMYEIDITGISGTVTNVREPTLQGFVSNGIDRIVTNAVKAFFSMYEASLLQSVPALLQTTLRDVINKNLIDDLVNDPSNKQCLKTTQTNDNEYIDFRDLLLPPEMAAIYGGSGDKPYGDLAATLMTLLEDQFFGGNTGDLVPINSIVIAPATQAQSGVQGQLLFPSTIFSYTINNIANDVLASFLTSIAIEISSARIDNLDTIVAPTSLLSPTQSLYQLSNILQLGPVTDRPLGASIRLLLDIQGHEEDSPITMRNEMDISAIADSSTISTNLYATMSSSKFLQMPLKDILDVNCWVATIPAPTLDADGFRIGNDNDSDNDDLSLVVQSFFVQLSQFDLGVNCVSCSSPGLGLLPELLNLLKETSATQMISVRGTALIRELMESEYIQTHIDRLIYNAPKLCRSNEGYNPEYSSPMMFVAIPFPALSNKAVDTFLYTGLIALEVATVVLVDTARQNYDINSSDALSAQKMLTDETASTLFDWQEMDGPIGSLVDLALTEGRNYLNSIVQDESNDESSEGLLGINKLLQDQILDESGVLSIPVNGLQLNILGFDLTLDNLRISGLDTIQQLDIFLPIAPQTLNNTITLQQIKVELDLVLTSDNDNDGVDDDDDDDVSSTVVSFAFGVKDITAILPVFLGLDSAKLGGLGLGSFLQLENVLPCLLSALDEFQVTQLLISAGEFEDPIITGLMSDTSKSLMTFTNKLSDQYGDDILIALPQLFDTTIRTVLNGLITNLVDDSACNKAETDEASTSPFVDFHAFFDDETKPYGEVPVLMKNMIDSLFESKNDDDVDAVPAINDLVISPVTKRQSGEAGTVAFEQDIFHIKNNKVNQFGLDSIKIRMFEPEMKNLNTIRTPTKLLEPREGQQFLLDNLLSIGNVSNPLSFAFKVFLGLSGDSILAFQNEVKISVDMPAVEVFLALLAKLDVKRLLNFPLEDITDLSCWLALPDAPKLDESGIRVPGSDSGLALDFVSLAASMMHFNIECTACNSTGLDMLPNIFATLEQNKITELLGMKVTKVVETLMTTEYLQTFVDRFLVSASQRCPHISSNDIDGIANGTLITDFPMPSFPVLPYESLETLVFASLAMFQVAIIVIAADYAEIDQATTVETTLPLFANTNDYDNNSTMELLDFTNFGGSLGEWVNVGIDEVNNYLLSSSDDGTIQVNTLIQDFILDEDGNLLWDFDDLVVGNDDMQIALRNLQITGLDSITSLDALNITGPQTLSNAFEWDMIQIDTVVSIRTSNHKDDASGRGLQKQQDLQVSLQLNNVAMDLALLLALDLDHLGLIELSSILRIDNILPCILSAIKHVSLTELKLSVGAVESFTITGFDSTDIENALSQTSNVLFEEYGEYLQAALPNIFDITIKNVINNYIDDYFNQEANTNCPSYDMDTTADNAFIDFRTLLLLGDDNEIATAAAVANSQYGDLIQTIMGYVNNTILKIDPQTGLSAINDMLIAPLTKSLSNETGTVIFNGDLFDTGRRIKVGGLKADIKLRASNARIENLDTISQPLDLLEAIPDNGHELSNMATFGVNDRPLRFAINFLFALTDNDGLSLSNDLDISLDLHSASIMLQVLLKIAESRFLGFPLKDMLNVNCWLATLPAPALDQYGVRQANELATAAITDLVITISQLNLNVNCISCSSPGMEDLTELLSSPEGAKDATEVANNILDYVTKLLGGEFVQVQLDRLLNDAAKQCPHSPMYEPNAVVTSYETFETEKSETSTSVLLVMGVVVVSVVAAISTLMMFVRCTVRRRHRKWVKSIPANQAMNVLKHQKDDDKLETELNNMTKSLFQSSDIPLYVRWFMPVVIVGNIIFFLSGHLSLGATVNIEAEVAGENLRVEKFFEFSMAQSTIDIWEAGGKELAIMLLIFSGIFPYTKQLITLGLWFLPPSKLSISSRGSALLWLDWLAKWSMVDIFVLVISIAAFRVSILSPNVAFLPESFYSINLLVVPLWGLYANMTAQLISQISSHYIIHYHRRVVEQATKTYRERHPLSESRTLCSGDGDDECPSTTSSQEEQSTSSSSSINNVREQLYTQSFARPHRGESARLVVRSVVNYPLVLASIALSVMVVVGSCLPIFSLDVLGVIGVAVESGQEFNDATTYHNLFSILRLLIDEARFLDYTGGYIGLGSLCALVFCTVLIAPIVQTVALLVQWFYSVDMKTRGRLRVFIEILQAWQYAEVFLISIFIASWQLGPISEFMINDYCGGLDATFAQLIYYGILSPDDAQCFKVDSRMEIGFFILAGATIVLALINTFVNKAVNQYFRDKNDQDRLMREQTSSSTSSKLTAMDAELCIEAIDDDTLQLIRPVPVLFSDSFRWLLRAGQGVPFECQCDMVSTIGIENGIEQYNSSQEEYFADQGDDENEIVSQVDSFSTVDLSEPNYIINEQKQQEQEQQLSIYESQSQHSSNDNSAVVEEIPTQEFIQQDDVVPPPPPPPEEKGEEEVVVEDGLASKEIVLDGNEAMHEKINDDNNINNNNNCGEEDDHDFEIMSMADTMSTITYSVVEPYIMSQQKRQVPLPPDECNDSMVRRSNSIRNNSQSTHESALMIRKPKEQQKNTLFVSSSKEEPVAFGVAALYDRESMR